MTIFLVFRKKFEYHQNESMIEGSKSENQKS